MKKAVFLLALIMGQGELYSAGFLQIQSFKVISVTSQAVSVSAPTATITGCGNVVTAPSGTLSAFFLCEGSGGQSVDAIVSTRVALFAGPGAGGVVWNSTGGAKGNPAVSNRGTTGYMSIDAPDGNDVWDLHAGDSTNGMQTVMACIEPRQGSRQGGIWSHENNSGTTYAYVLFITPADKVTSRLSSTVGAGVSTLTSGDTLNIGARNSVIARVDKTQTQALSTRMWINKVLQAGSATGSLAATAPADTDLRFGNMGADPTASFSDTNMSMYFYLERNVTQGEIDTFDSQCKALTP